MTQTDKLSNSLIELCSMLENIANYAKSLGTCYSLRGLRMVARNSALLAKSVDALHQKLFGKGAYLAIYPEDFQSSPYDKFDRPIALQLYCLPIGKWETIALFRERELEVAMAVVRPDKPLRLVDDLTQIVLSEFNPKTKSWSR